MDQFSNIMTSHMSDLFDDDSINKINNLTAVKPIVQDDELFPEEADTTEANFDDKIEVKVENVEENKLDVEKIKSSLNTLKKQIDDILNLLSGQKIDISVNEATTTSNKTESKKVVVKETPSTTSAEVDFLEGVFNGEKMLGGDGKEYQVPPNYASKSKLVEGDIMKLTFAPNGRFIYKQIGPIARKRIIGVLQFDEERQLWNVHHEGKKYKVLTASVTFYKGKPNDEAVALIPEENDCDWCAMENIISK